MSQGWWWIFVCFKLWCFFGWTYSWEPSYLFWWNLHATVLGSVAWTRRTRTRTRDWKLIKGRRGGKYILFLLVGQFSTLMLSVLLCCCCCYRTNDDDDRMMRSEKDFIWPLHHAAHEDDTESRWFGGKNGSWSGKSVSQHSCLCQNQFQFTIIGPWLSR